MERNEQTKQLLEMSLHLNTQYLLEGFSINLSTKLWVAFDFNVEQCFVALLTEIFNFAKFTFFLLCAKEKHHILSLVL